MKKKSVDITVLEILTKHNISMTEGLVKIVYLSNIHIPKM